MKSKIIYKSTSNQDAELKAGGIFLPTYDTTNHLHFMCDNCKSAADVLDVNYKSDRDGSIKYSLYIGLYCPECGNMGYRKIHLDARDDSCKFQHTYDSAGKRYYFSESRKPIWTMA